MAIMHYTPETSPQYGAPSIRISRTHSFRINSAACKLLGVKVNDKVIISHDSDKNEWYLSVSPDGFTLRDARSSLEFTNKWLSAKILDANGLKDVHYAVRIQEKPVVLKEKNNGIEVYRLMVPKK